MNMCWHNNLRDMINHQNALFSRRNFWNEGVWLGFSSWYERVYEGWNEIPVDRKIITQPQMWDAFVVKLPANICEEGGANDSLTCLSHRAKVELETKFRLNEQAGILKPGIENLHAKPGSYMSVVREVKNSNGEWTREFFCEDWRSPSGEWRVKFVQPTATNPEGACYVEKGYGEKAAEEPSVTKSILV